jgi:hypothetical protein
MTILKSYKNTLLASLAALGVTTLGTVGSASAHPTSTPQTRPAPAPARTAPAKGHWVRVGSGYQWRAATRVNVGPNHYALSKVYDPYDLNRDGRLDHIEIDFRHYDANRNRVLDPGERIEYWRHMGSTGRLGSLSIGDVTRVSQVAHIFDQNKDGRLLGVEKRGLDLYLEAMRSFDRADRNRDGKLTIGERRRAGPALFGDLRIDDRNRGRQLTRAEVRSAVVASFRAGRA